MDHGDFILLYTDGIIEAEDRDGREFGLKRLEQMVSELGDFSAEEFLQTLENAVNQFIGNSSLSDDITIVIAKRL